MSRMEVQWKSMKVPLTKKVKTDTGVASILPVNDTKTPPHNSGRNMPVITKVFISILQMIDYISHKLGIHGMLFFHEK